MFDEIATVILPRRCLLTGIALSVLLIAVATADDVPELNVTRIDSSIDGRPQPISYWAPAAASQQPAPLLVSLHTWSSDYRQDRSPWLQHAVQRGWIYIQPNFRGVNDHPEACGSPLARQDVLDAVDWAVGEFHVDASRIYLAGVSGGGHMTMQMAAHHPERFSAVSAWCGPSDLAAWHRFHSPSGQPQNYARMIAACCGGPPGRSGQVDAEYTARSPLYHLHQVGDLYVDLNAGVHDGKTGSVPIHHTLRAYNRIAEAHESPTIPASLLDQLWQDGRLDHPLPSDLEQDATYGREILLRRQSKNARVTIFEGTHEALPEAACAWLASKTRQTHRTH